jgi:hypothetical protein
VDEQERTSGDGAPTATPSSVDENTVSIRVLKAQQERANLAVASAPEIVEELGEFRVRAIFRRVEPNTPA